MAYFSIKTRDSVPIRIESHNGRHFIKDFHQAEVLQIKEVYHDRGKLARKIQNKTFGRGKTCESVEFPPTVIMAG